ncbi:hypothetical protein [Streptomyces sp. TLI_171]|uniref:hypothetical protein n=1 Tax=Streptomyces sp. TLI_171 TaxID=1938859 RepID=UPI000C17876A|nr:hypothetical protein [Streptomyces sp. TLI_171]RKE19582.1 hypothetical protein BX266_2905 [Streptomyces sp. TLI_171]
MVLGWSAGLLAVYGLVRLVPGSRGVGAGWMLGHLALFAALVLLGIGLAELRRRAGRRGVWGRVWLAVGWAGTAAGLAQTGIDLYVGAVARDAAEKSDLFDRVQAVPGVLPLVYTVVPMFLYVGLIALLVRLTILRLAPWWSPALVLLGTLAMGASLDFLAVGAGLYLVAFLPVISSGRRRPQAVPSGA